MPVNSFPYANTSVSSTAILVIGAEVKLASIDIRNPNTTEAFLQIFESMTAAGVTVGTTVPKLFIPVQGGDGTNSGLTPKEYINPALLKGMVIAATTTPGGSGTPSSALAVSLTYNY